VGSLGHKSGTYWRADGNINAKPNKSLLDGKSIEGYHVEIKNTL
jgi:hypothetical protein